jgi:hypothetical protein
MKIYCRIRVNSPNQAGQPSLRANHFFVPRQQVSKARLRDSPACELQFPDYAYDNQIDIRIS